MFTYCFNESICICYTFLLLYFITKIDERCKGMSRSGTITFYCIALYLLKLNICFSLQVNMKLNNELVYFVPLIPQVKTLYWTLVFAHDLGQDYTAISRARCCTLNVIWMSTEWSQLYCVLCRLHRDRLPSTDVMYTSVQTSQLP